MGELNRKNARAFYGKGDPLMEAAFVSFVQWAMTDSATKLQFSQDTKITLPSTPLDAMIDQATGYQGELTDAFIDWVIVNLWGEEQEGERFRGEINVRSGARPTQPTLLLPL